MASIDGIKRPERQRSQPTAPVALPEAPVAKPAPESVELPPVKDTNPTKPPKRGFFSKWSPLVVMSLALAIIIIDTTVLNVSIRTIILELHTNIQALQWVISAYSLTLAALTVTGGRLGDLFGRKRMFMLGAIIFAVGSFLASISQSASMLLIGESIVEGLGAALMMPATASLLITEYSGRDRALAFGMWGGIAAASSAIGPILGGYLTTNYSWRWAFRINIGVALILLLGSIVIHEVRDREERAELDFLGVLLSAAGLLGIVYGVIESSTYGWYKATQPFAIFGHSLPAGLSVTPLSIAAGIFGLILFALWQARRAKVGRTPLVSLKLFANGQFTSGAVTMGTLALGQMGLFFALPIFLQAVRGLDALHTGYALLPMSLTLLFAAPLSGFISKFIKPKTIIQIGLLLDLAATFVIRQSLTVTANIRQLAPGLMIYGFGMGLVMAQISNITLSAVSVQQAGEASGVNNTMRQVGSTLGSAIVGAVLLSSLAAGLTHRIATSSQIPQQAKPAIQSAAAAHGSAVEFGGTGQLIGNASPTIRAELTQIINESTVEANRKVMLYMAGAVALALLVSTRLPSIKNVERGESAAGH